MPSPLAGEGDSEIQQARMGEGLRLDPSPHLCRGNAELPSPARGEGRRANAAISDAVVPTRSTGLAYAPIFRLIASSTNKTASSVAR
jgi:hypothetical protein